jgi:hypothetical protein
VKIGAYVLVAMFLLAPGQGIAQTEQTNSIKVAGACSFKSAKNCFDWCKKQGKAGQFLEKCTTVCKQRHPDC